MYEVRKIVLDKNDMDKCIKDAFSNVNDKKIIGYMFLIKKDSVILSLHLVTKSPTSIGLNELLTSWRNQVRFKNPPLECWMAGKKGWCKKLAILINKQYKLPIDDALSEIYLTIIKCYNNPKVYMGSLNYIKIAVHNSIRLNYRNNKNKLWQSNPRVMSLNVPIDSNNLLLGDILGEEDTIAEDIDTRLALERVISLLRFTFSDREIDQIMRYDIKYLPNQLTRRLGKWRSKHKLKDYF